MTVKQVDFLRSQLVQKPVEVSFHVPTSFFVGLGESLPRHLAVRREGHRKFGSGRRGGGKRLAIEERCFDVVRSHRGACERSARFENQGHRNQIRCRAHRAPRQDLCETSLANIHCLRSVSCPLSRPVDALPATLKRKSRAARRADERSRNPPNIEMTRFAIHAMLNLRLKPPRGQ